MLHGSCAAARGGAGGPLGARPNKGAACACAAAQPRPACRRDGGRRRASGHLLHGLGRRACGRARTAGGAPVRRPLRGGGDEGGSQKDLLAIKVGELSSRRSSRRAAKVGRATRRGCAGACMRRLCA
eukprot:6928996-Prymnesium_polylepis.1